MRIRSSCPGFHKSRVVCSGRHAISAALRVRSTLQANGATKRAFRFEGLACIGSMERLERSECAAEGYAMKTFVMKSIGQVGFAEKPVPRPGPMDAIVKTTMALICTSDSHTVRGQLGRVRILPWATRRSAWSTMWVPKSLASNPATESSSALLRPIGATPPRNSGRFLESGQALGGWKFARQKDGVFR